MRLILLLASLLIAQAGSAAPTVLTVAIDGVVHPITTEMVSHVVDRAQREHHSLILIRLNTPGGLLDATRQVIEKLVSSPVPVVTYVTPSGGRAASAGFLILEAGDVAVMAPGTNTGAASPVLMGEQMDPVMRRKVENDTSAALRSIVTKRGRNAELAETAVREAKSFTEKEALENKLIDLVSANEQQLLQQLDGREVVRFDGSKQKLQLTGASIVEYNKTTRERIISAISDPNLAFILLVIGALGIYVEFSSPGLIAPGVAGAIMVLLGLSALSVLPVNWVGVALLLLAVTLFLLEAKFASHGILGLGGTVAMVLGSLLLIDGPPELRIRLTTAVAVTVPFAAITIFLVSLVVQARRNKVVTGDAGMLNEIGSAVTVLNPEGKVFVHGEYWDASAAAEVTPGTKVRVVEVDGLKLKVEPLT